jgi:acyl-CoA reductase-like NAD-dependent aldehyde dehydrogenase
VAPFLRIADEDKAVAIANDSPYGLQAAVYTRDIARALRVADALDVGGVVVNGSSCFRPGNVPYLPRKRSGLGADNLHEVHRELTTGKAIVIQGLGR